MKKSLVILLVAVIAAGGLYYVFVGDGANQNDMAPGGAPPTAVKAQVITAKQITMYEELPGRTSAFKVAQIRPQVSGIVTKRLFEEGSVVTEGQQLYQIDPAPYRAAYNRTLADLQKAKANAKAIIAKETRYQELVKINAVSLQEYDDIKASLDQAKADIAVANAMVAAAKIDLDYTKVYAPIAGRIGKSTVTEGALVSAGQADPLSTVTQLNPIYVDMSQSSADMQRMRGKLGADQKNPVTLTMDGTGQSYEEKGTLQFSDVSVDATTSSVQLRAIFPNEDERLLPGLFVRARIDLGTVNAILVPQRATTRNPDGSLVVWTVAADNTANPTPIQVEREYEDQWIVTSGLKEGDKVIIEGYQKVAPGAPVSTDEKPAGLVPAEGAAPAPAEGAAPTETLPTPEEAPQTEQPAAAEPTEENAAPVTEDAAPAQEEEEEEEEPIVEDMSAPQASPENPAAPAQGLTAKELMAPSADTIPMEDASAPEDGSQDETTPE